MARFEAMRPRMLAMLRRRISARLCARIDPESMIHDAFLHALPRWLALSSGPATADAWIVRQLLDQYCESMRAALGPTRDAARFSAGVHTGGACQESYWGLLAEMTDNGIDELLN